MVKEKIGIKVAIFILVSVLFMNFVSAANVGISPASLYFKEVLRGGYAEKNVVVSIDATRPIEIEVVPRGVIESWLNFSEMNFSITREKPYNLGIFVNPPIDIPNGNYTGFVRISTSEFGGGVEGHAVGIIRSALDLAVLIEVTDTEIVQCSVSDYDVQTVEQGDDIIFKMNLANNGNIRLKPRIVVDIWDQEQISLVESKEFTNKEILPTTKDGFEVRVSSENLDLGQYWADISVMDCFASHTLTFDVLEEGALRAAGVLLGIVTKKRIDVGETAPISIKFKNTGEKEVQAQFKGKISLEGSIEEILESDKFAVPIGESYDFNLFYTPSKKGDHIISGRVFYSGKRTFEGSTTLRAVSKNIGLKYPITLIAYIVLIFFILLLFLKIHKERKSFLKRLKNEK